MSRDGDGLRRKEEEKEFAEEASSLWLLVMTPTIWAAHFVTSYAATSLACVKFPGPDGIPRLQWLVGGLTAAALLAIVWLGWRAWRQWDYLDDGDYSHRTHSTEDRHEFLGHAAFLLAIVSFIGVAFVAMPVWLTGVCR